MNERQAATKKERIREEPDKFGPLEGDKALQLTLLRNLYKDHQKEIQRTCVDCKDKKDPKTKKDPETWCTVHQFGGRAWIIWLETMSKWWDVTFDESFGKFRSSDLRESLPNELQQTVRHKCEKEADDRKRNDNQDGEGSDQPEEVEI